MYVKLNKNRRNSLSILMSKMGRMVTGVVLFSELYQARDSTDKTCRTNEDTIWYHMWYCDAVFCLKDSLDHHG